MKKTITEVETAIENRIAEREEEYELDIYDRNDIREEEYQKAGWRHDPFPEELEEDDEEEEDDDGTLPEETNGTVSRKPASYRKSHRRKHSTKEMRLHRKGHGVGLPTHGLCTMKTLTAASTPLT